MITSSFLMCCIYNLTFPNSPGNFELKILFGNFWFKNWPPLKKNQKILENLFLDSYTQSEFISVKIELIGMADPSIKTFKSLHVHYCTLPQHKLNFDCLLQSPLVQGLQRIKVQDLVAGIPLA